MCETSQPEALHQLTPLLAGFHAKTSLLPVMAQGWRVSGPGCFTRWRESFASYDRNSGSWKTSQRSLLGGLMPFSERWPRSGMMRAGECSVHERWAHPTSANGGFVLPGDRGGGPPPPRSCSAMQAEITPQRAQDKHPNLEVVVARQTWPTPCSRDWKDRGENTDYHKVAAKGKLTGWVMVQPDTEVGRLNPEWVEMLMGFPPGWTDAPLGTEEVIDRLTAGPHPRDHSTLTSHPAPDPSSPTTESD